MMLYPSRITALIQRYEAGETPTGEDLRRIAALQALDLAKMGEDFVQQVAEQDARQTEEFKAYLEAQ